MSELVLPPLASTAAYPEQAFERPGIIDRIADRLVAPAARRLQARKAFDSTIVEAVRQYAKETERLSDAGVKKAAAELRLVLRRDGFTVPAVAQSFALIREVAGRAVGMRHFDSQIGGGWIILNGMIAEMETGEGKTLTATLPACTAAMAGLPVHIITVNDYLTARDAEWMAPVYKMLGLTVGVVVNGKEPQARRAAYGCDVTYCTNKELTFDYLRDRIALGSQVNRIQLSIERVAGTESRSSKLVLRGLFFAIVDEADSVLVDEARTPLIISGRSDQAPEKEMYEMALAMVANLREGEDFAIEGGERHTRLTAQGKQKLTAAAETLPGLFRGTRRREELATQALVATHVFKRDIHYLVRDDKVQIIDESTGRILPDRSWEQGLHQMVEAKEGCPLTSQQTSVARMTYQRFFRRYLRLAGMTGTAHEIAPELVVGLPAAGRQGADEPAGESAQPRPGGVRDDGREVAWRRGTVARAPPDRAAGARRHALGRRVRGAQPAACRPPGSSISC